MRIESKISYKMWVTYVWTFFILVKQIWFHIQMEIWLMFETNLTVKGKRGKQN